MMARFHVAGITQTGLRLHTRLPTRFVSAISFDCEVATASHNTPFHRPQSTAAIAYAVLILRFSSNLRFPGKSARGDCRKIIRPGFPIGQRDALL